MEVEAMTRLRHESHMLSLDAGYWWRVACRLARQRWCHWRQHWRRERPIRQEVGYECWVCGVWWPDLVAMGAAPDLRLPLREVEAEARRQECEVINVGLARRVR
jgi:hypothetical protein